MPRWELFQRRSAMFAVPGRQVQPGGKFAVHTLPDWVCFQCIQRNMHGLSAWKYPGQLDISKYAREQSDVLLCVELRQHWNRPCPVCTELSTGMVSPLQQRRPVADTEFAVGAASLASKYKEGVMTSSTCSHTMSSTMSKAGATCTSKTSTILGHSHPPRPARPCPR
jgi:hypothetical protein